MTYVGHTLTGAAIGVATCPRSFSSGKRTIWIGVCAVGGSIPDIPLPGWGHDRYDISHSAFVLLAVAIVSSFASYVIQKKSQEHASFIPDHSSPPNPWWRLLLVIPVCWASHLLLDSFYMHGHGIMIGWPFVDFRLCLPIPCFDWLDSNNRLGAHSMRVYGIELLCYGPLVLVAVIIRYVMARRSVAV